MAPRRYHIIRKARIGGKRGGGEPKMGNPILGEIFREGAHKRNMDKRQEMNRMSGSLSCEKRAGRGGRQENLEAILKKEGRG